jgi:hypothetical protein
MRHLLDFQIYKELHQMLAAQKKHLIKLYKLNWYNYFLIHLLKILTTFEDFQ